MGRIIDFVEKNIIGRAIDFLERYWLYLAFIFTTCVFANFVYTGRTSTCLLILFAIPFLYFVSRGPVPVLFAQFVFTCVYLFFSTNLGVSFALAYITDLLSIMLFLFIALEYNRSSYKLEVLKPVFTVVLVMFAFNILSSIYNGNNLVPFIWGIRQNYRFFVFFIGTIFFADEYFFDAIWKITKVLFALQVIIISIEFFFFDYHVDQMGGTYGLIGGTAFLINFFIYALLLAYQRYIDKKISVYSFWTMVILTLYTTTLNEGKAMIVYILILPLIMFIQSKITFKKLSTLVLILIGLMISMDFIQKLYPSFNNFFTLEKMSQYISDGAYGGSSVNRLNGPAYFAPLLDAFQDLFGVGLGDAFTTDKVYFTGEFTKLYQSTNYFWFAIAYFYLQSGWVGLILYFATFAVLAYVYYKIKNHLSYGVRGLALGMIIVTIFTTVYNNSLTLEAVGYTHYMFLAMPFAMLFNSPRKNQPTRKINKGAK